MQPAGAYPARSPCCATRSSRTPGRSMTTFRCEIWAVAISQRQDEASAGLRGLSAPLRLLARSIQRLAACPLRLLVFGHRVLWLVGLRLFAFFVALHLTLRHGFPPLASE